MLKKFSEEIKEMAKEYAKLECRDEPEPEELRIRRMDDQIKFLAYLLDEFSKNPLQYMEKEDRPEACKKCGYYCMNCPVPKSFDPLEPCSDPNCGKLSACCGKKKVKNPDFGDEPEFICLGCFKIFTPAPCSHKEENLKQFLDKAAERYVESFELGKPTENTVEWQQELRKRRMKGDLLGDVSLIIFIRELLTQSKLDERKKIRGAIKQIKHRNDCKTLLCGLKYNDAIERALSLPELQD